METLTRPRRVRTQPRAKVVETAPAPLREPTYEQIQKRAYEIYLSRGATPGNPDWDWQQAELELKARIALLGNS
jgi:hypothetical protein